MTLPLPEFYLLLVDAGMLVLIWLVQTIIYPGFKRLESARFRDSHRAYARAMIWIVGPLMLAQLILSLLVCLSDPTPLNGSLLALVAATWVCTAALSVPLHRQLGTSGKDPAVIRRLIRTNWPRTMLWTLIPLLRLTATA